jgi:hypothetical protein
LVLQRFRWKKRGRVYKQKKVERRVAEPPLFAALREDEYPYKALFRSRKLALSRINQFRAPPNRPYAQREIFRRLEKQPFRKRDFSRRPSLTIASGSRNDLRIHFIVAVLFQKKIKQVLAIKPFCYNFTLAFGRERSSVGRASPCQGERRGFKSLRSLHFLALSHRVPHPKAIFRKQSEPQISGLTFWLPIQTQSMRSSKLIHPLRFVGPGSSVSCYASLWSDNN